MVKRLRRRRVSWEIFDPRLLILFRQHGTQWRLLAEEIKLPVELRVMPKTIQERCKLIVPPDEYKAAVERARIIREHRSPEQRIRKNGSRTNVPPCGKFTLPPLPSLQVPLPVIDF